MLVRIRFKLAQWIIGKSGVILDARTMSAEYEGEPIKASYPDMADPTEATPQEVWRATRAELVAKRGK